MIIHVQVNESERLSKNMNGNPRVVAVSLGSNGFHLHSLEHIGGSFKPGSHLHEPVQIESFLDEQGEINNIGMARTLEAMDKFSTHLQEFSVEAVGAIATGTFRKAKNGQAVIEQAGERLGHPVRIISGREESLLCYTGIASVEGVSDQHRLVIDVGGASTELMIAREYTLEQFFSMDVGCVSLANRYLPDTNINTTQFDEAVRYARESVSPFADVLKATGWSEVMGCGGTVSSLFTLLHRNRLTGLGITSAALDRFQSMIVSDDQWATLADREVGPHRTRLLPAGAALLLAVFQVMEVERLKPVFSSVARGLLVQLARSVSPGNTR